jgi:hypothetical protein
VWVNRRDRNKKEGARGQESGQMRATGSEHVKYNILVALIDQ